MSNDKPQPTYQDLERERSEAKARLQTLLEPIRKLKATAEVEGNKDLASALEYLLTIKL